MLYSRRFARSTVEAARAVPIVYSICTVKFPSASVATAAFRPTRTLHGKKYRHFSPDDPFGEKAALDEAEFFETQLKDIDLDAVRRLAETPSTTEGIFAPSEEMATLQRIRRTLTAVHKEEESEKLNDKKSCEQGLSESADPASSIAPRVLSSMEGLSEEERLVLIAEQMTDEERRVASTLPGGFTQWLGMSESEKKRIRADYAFSERQRAAKDHWSKKSYSSYEEYIRREVIGTSADEVIAAAAADESNPEVGHVEGGNDGQNSATHSSTASSSSLPCEREDEMAFEDEEDDDLTTLNPRAGVALPNLQPHDVSKPESTGADQFIGDADAMRAAIKREEESSKDGGEGKGGDEGNKMTIHSSDVAGGVEELTAVRMYEQGPDAPPYPLPKTDPSKWGTEDVIAWLDCFAEEGVMDEEMIKTFRMARVDGDMLLNKVMPPNLFKIMRKWHLHRSNPRTRHLAEELVVEAEVVQYTIYLCFPYCGQIGSY